jgi:hypothetical protein
LRLKILTGSPNYTGNRSRGVRVGSSATSGESTGNSGWSLVDVDSVNRVRDVNDDDNDNEELGADETDELVGQLVDYVSDLTLLP